ncbi:ATP-dependent DNA helicase [Synechococcus sp. CBW1107]|uniref:ATP-dependent DNA helicase n=1 Tax=Synechococcus sp. CBW1107 TaxID=2789857 RepID=UPI002AD58A5A|nr:AAA family ATPase [Synechococcus sp. CBW1107]CAK6692720.1 RecBCD enzyme subunit RecD [Synechococcus sp. CBW1107]
MQTENNRPARYQREDGNNKVVVSATEYTAASLTADQAAAFELLAPICRGEGAGARAVLTGYAGTGKTFLTARLIALALECIPDALGERHEKGKWSPPPSVVVAAPTHRASRHLASVLAEYGIEGVEVVTIHSALRLRPVRSGGTERFVPDRKGAQLIGDDTRLLIIDEISMVSAELTGLIEEALISGGGSILAVGDPAQLQPVSGEPSPLLRAPIRAHLSHVVRHQGPILELATNTRELGSGRPAFASSAGTSSEVIAHPTQSEWCRAAVDACLAANAAGDTDAARILCWTNAAVAAANAAIHRRIYGPEAAPFLAGQPIVSSGAITGPAGLPIAGASTEMLVTEAELIDCAAPGDDSPELLEVVQPMGGGIPEWSSWGIRAEVIAGGGWVEFAVLDPGCTARWREAQEAIASSARIQAKEGRRAEAAALWRWFWARRDRFAEVTSIWASTIHNSQGSTIERVFLHPDIDQNRDQVERAQLAYVGITRASGELHVVADQITTSASRFSRGMA